MTDILNDRARHARVLADELLPYFEEPLGALIREEIGDGATDVFDMTAAEHKEALDFLMAAPHMRSALVADLSPASARLALRARYIGLLIANTLSIASKSSQISDKHLSVAYAGEMIQQRPLEPTSPPSSTRRRPFPHFSEGKSGSPTFFPQFSPETATMTDTNTMEALAELFGTSTKNAAIRAVKLKLTPVCGRCCGTGAYSFNQIDGDRCFGCHGSGHAAVAPSNIASVVAAARLAIADGRHARYLDALANQRQAAEMSKRIFEAWRASAAARGNPSHTLRDEDCTEQQLRCRRANARIAAAYEALTPLDVAHKRNPTDDDHVAWKNALDTFFAVIAETDALLSEAGVAA